jgi:hypothetical protein
MFDELNRNCTTFRKILPLQVNGVEKVWYEKLYSCLHAEISLAFVMLFATNQPLSF